MRDLAQISLAYEQLKEEVEPLLFLARDRDLQVQGATLAREFVDKCHGLRLAAIMNRDERAANDLLGLASIGNALAFELDVYVLLKDGRSENAWVQLIDAQDAIAAASRASSSFTNLQAKFDHLRNMENWFFPPQSFTSAGMIAERQDCSICQDAYSKCDHIAGRIYMGRFCNIELKNIRPDHIALVKTPYDRRCRITSFAVSGGERNQMTWVIAPTAEANKGNMTAIVAVANSDEKY